VARGVRAVVLERVAGQVVVVVVSVVVLLVVPSPLRGLLGELGRAVPSAGAVAVAVVLGLAGFPRVRSASAGLAVGIRDGLLGARTGPAVLGLSLVAMAGHLALLGVAASAVGVHVAAAVLAPLLVLSLLSMGLPLSVGGWGPREATTAAAFGIAGLGVGTGLATAVAFGVLALISTLPGLGVLVLRRTVQRHASTPPNSPRATIRAPRASVA
jgi:hypothetical protein